MIGLIGSPQPEREGNFAKNFQHALFECLFEAVELIPCAFVLFIFGLGVLLLGSMVYHLMFDPNAVDVASRLETLSIDPDKWIRRL
jgi:hypothetical protein